MPSRKEDPLLRLVGWPLAGAFVLAGLWEVAAPLGRLGAAQILIAGLLVLLAAAYLRLARAGSRSGIRLSVADRWLIAPTVGIYFAWITAANAVSLTSLAARSGLVDGAGARNRAPDPRHDLRLRGAPGRQDWPAADPRGIRGNGAVGAHRHRRQSVWCLSSHDCRRGSVRRAGRGGPRRCALYG